MEVKQPFSLTDIAKFPKECLIAILIGLLWYFIERADLAAEESARLNARIDSINTDRVRLYDKLFLQRQLLEQQQESDSVLRAKTTRRIKQLLR